GWLARMLRSASYAGELVVASEGVHTLGGEQHDHDHGDHAAGDHDHGHSHAAGGPDDGPPDPHAWQDPGNVQIYVRNIAAALGRVDPGHQADYTQRAEDYIGKLEALDAWIAEQVGTVPEARRKVIISHASLGYYGKRYG